MARIQQGGGFTALIGRILFKQHDIVLHYHPFSFYSRLILMALSEKKLPFSQQVVDTSDEDKYYDGGLGLNHLADYPVFWDAKHNVAIKEPADIIRHVEKNHKGKVMLQPDDQSEIYIADEIVHRVQHLRLETLTFGSIMFDDLELEPQGPFMIEAIRSKMIEGLRKRHAVFQDDLTDSPQESGSIDDLDGWHLLQSRENFEVLIKGFERELDHCEMELRNRSFKEQDPKKQWLCSSKLTFADVCLGMALWHLEQLGFYKRLIAPRPHLTQYYGRIQKVDSFKKATTYPASSLRPPSTTTLIETRRVWQMPENPWSLMFLLLPFGMIGFIAFIDYMKPLGPRDPYYVPRLRSHFPSVQYRSTGSVLYTS